jgi:hypothetical protein
MLSRYLPWILVGIVTVVSSAQFLTRRYSEWESVYVPTAQRLADGSPLYLEGDPYLYPPFVAVLALPWTAVPAWLGRLVWFAVSAWSVAVVVGLGWRIAGGTAQETTPRDWLTWALGLACGGLYLQNSWAHQQTDLLLLALQIVGLWLLMRQRETSAGLLFGLAAAIKCTPLLWLPFLIWRGRWAGALTLVVVGLGVSLLPDLWVRAPEGTWLGQYARRVAAPDRPIGVWGTDPLYNQSLAGTSLRWLAVETVAQPGGGLQTRFHPDRLDSIGQRRVLMLLAGLLLVVTLVCAGRPGSVAPEALAWEGATVLLLALLLSPMSGPAHFGGLTLAGFLLARAGGRSKFLALLVAGLSLLSAKDLVRTAVYDHALFYGHITFSTLLLLGGCWWGRWSVRQETNEPKSATEPRARVA